MASDVAPQGPGSFGAKPPNLLPRKRRETPPYVLGSPEQNIMLRQKQNAALHAHGALPLGGALHFPCTATSQPNRHAALWLPGLRTSPHAGPPESRCGLPPVSASYVAGRRPLSNGTSKVCRAAPTSPSVCSSSRRAGANGIPCSSAPSQTCKGDDLKIKR